MITEPKQARPRIKPLRMVMHATGLFIAFAVLIVAALLVIGLALPLAPIPDFGKSMPAYRVTNIAVVDVDVGQLQWGTTVAVANGRIVAVGKDAMDARLAGYRGSRSLSYAGIVGLAPSHG